MKKICVISMIVFIVSFCSFNYDITVNGKTYDLTPSFLSVDMAYADDSGDDDDGGSIWDILKGLVTFNIEASLTVTINSNSGNGNNNSGGSSGNGSGNGNNNGSEGGGDSGDNGSSNSGNTGSGDNSNN